MARGDCIQQSRPGNSNVTAVATVVPGIAGCAVRSESRAVHGLVTTLTQHYFCSAACAPALGMFTRRLVQVQACPGLRYEVMVYSRRLRRRVASKV